MKKILNSCESLFNKIEIKVHGNDRFKKFILVDSPDYDSTAESHIRTARLLLHAAHTIITVLSPAKYGDQISMTWYSQLREMDCHVIPVLNKIDSVEIDSRSDLLNSCARLLGLTEEEIYPISCLGDVSETKSILSMMENYQKDFDSSQKLESQLQYFRVRMQEEILALDEIYGTRSLGFASINSELEKVREKFWERHKLLRRDIEGDLRKRLSSIAEKIGRAHV